VHVDVQDAQFDNKCPSDKSELEQVDDDLENVKCPRCGKTLEIEEMKPLAAGDSTSG